MKLLTLAGVTKRFGGLMALNGVDLSVESGSIHGLIGPNGAGKTTVFNVVTGIYAPDGGTVGFGGADITGLRPHQIAAGGIGRTFQNIELFKSMTVLENVLVGMHTQMRARLLSCGVRTGRQRQEEREMRERALEILRFVGLDDLVDAEAGSVPFGQQRLLEIGRAVALEPKLLLLDEPAAGMNHREIEGLKKLLQAVQRRWTLTILLVEHVMELVMDISDRISVLHYGEKIAEGAPEEVRKDERVVEAYLGRRREPAGRR